jgi:hypothetical protein
MPVLTYNRADPTLRPSLDSERMDILVSHDTPALAD